MFTPLGLLAAMLGSMAAFVLLAWLGVSLADFVLRFLGYSQPEERRAKRHCRIAYFSNSLSPDASDAVYSHGLRLGTPFAAFTEITPSSLREELDPTGGDTRRARFDSEGKFHLEPDQN